MFFSATMLPPLFVSVFYQDGAHAIFIKAAAVIFASGFSLWLLFRRFTEALRTKDGFLVTVLCYITLGCFSALPFTDSPNTALSLVDALFESFSGLTTTGATVMIGLGITSPVAFVLSTTAAMAGRHGHHCLWRSPFWAHAGHWGHAVVSNGNAWPGKRQVNSPHESNRPPWRYGQFICL